MSVVYPTASMLASGTNSLGNITLGAAGASTVTMSGAGGSGGSGSVLMANGGTSANWASTNAKMTTKGQLHLEGETADIVMNGVSLKDVLGSITDRLAILQPKTELIEKYDNLRQAYEHYKTLEALLHQADDDAK